MIASPAQRITGLEQVPSGKSILTIKHSKIKSLSMTQQVLHPMVKMQRQVESLVSSKILKPGDGIWKIAFLYGDKWQYWKNELLDFGFTLQDPVSALLEVEGWDEN
jgi:Domain of unknown function (DUF4327)